MSQTRNQITQTSNTEPFLPCERLDVYRVALEFRQSLGILDTVRNISALRDQIIRASDSIVLNIAEGAGRIARADKRRHYSYALGSAMECGAALALLHANGAIRTEAYEIRRMMIIRVIQMLYRLAGPPR
jgi:four helix bundle protein